MKDKKAINISNNEDEEASPIGVARKANTSQFKWNILYTDTMKKAQTKGLNKRFGLKIAEPFFIVSRLPMRRVL